MFLKSSAADLFYVSNKRETKMHKILLAYYLHNKLMNTVFMSPEKIIFTCLAGNKNLLPALKVGSKFIYQVCFSGCMFISDFK